ncbi:hypothetical protein ES705_16429 [subsurface metagenome]
MIKMAEKVRAIQLQNEFWTAWGETVNAMRSEKHAEACRKRIDEYMAKKYSKRWREEIYHAIQGRSNETRKK